MLLGVFAADPEDLYTRTGTDPTPSELVANGSIVLGERWSNSTVTGSQVAVNDTLLEQQTGVLGPTSSISGVHIPISGRRSDYADITRWYQQDGNTQIFRLFQGEHNYRKGNVGEDPAVWYATAPPSRVEAVSPTLTVASGAWREWEGTYTIIQPLNANIFQLFHDGSDLWAFHLDMTNSGEIEFLRRRDVADLPSRITVATNMIGKSLSIKVRANGFNYEVYRKIPLVDNDWTLVTIGSYQQSPSNKVIFRWGMYPGSQAGSTTSDGMLFVSGATISTSTAPPVTPPPPPITYYWDNDGATAGFGRAGGTWAASTTGSAAQGWTTDSTGATLPVNVTTNAYDPVNFGNGATGLASGTITVSGAVTSGNMTFASGSGAITLSGGSITLPPADMTITVSNNAPGGNVINSVIAGDGTNLTVQGRYKLTLNGANTYSGKTVLGDNTNTLTVGINSIADVGGGASSLGAPTNAGTGLIQIGSVSRTSILALAGASAASSTDRKVQIGSVANGSGGAQIHNNSSDPGHTLTFSNPAFNAAAIGPYSATSRALALGGSNTGDNTIAGAIIDNGVSEVRLDKGGTGTWVLAGSNSYSGSTNVYAGTLKNSTSGSGTTHVTVAGGATLGVIVDTAGGQWVNADDLSFYNSSTVLIDYGTLTASTTVAPIQVRDLSLGTGLTMQIGTSNFAPGQSYPLLTWTGTGPTDASAFTTLIAPSRFTGNLSVSGSTLFYNVIGATTGYNTWAGTNVGGQGPDLDFDNDGVENGVEFFMNAAAGFTANPQLDGTNTITWPNGGNIDASEYGPTGQFVVQTSSDLSTWADVDVGSLTTNADGPGGLLTYTLTGASPRFVRFKVTPN
jgi:autotransporter-associated beta strand protein